MKVTITADPINVTCFNCLTEMQFCLDNGNDRVDIINNKFVATAHNRMLCFNCKTVYLIDLKITREI